MQEPFTDILTIGGKTNSLGRADEVIKTVLQDKARLDELLSCVFHDDAWVRMRAIDSVEKICRLHPDWFAPYIDMFLRELSVKTQPSIQWHLAQIFIEVTLTKTQEHAVIRWLRQLLTTTEVDWITASNAMESLVHFTFAGSIPLAETRALLTVQQHHKSAAVVKRASRLLQKLSELV